MFEFLKFNSSAYQRRVETMLRESRFAQLEHQAAAEHHEALARMYAERVNRLENVAHQFDEKSQSTFGTLNTTALSAGDAPRTDRAAFRVLHQNPQAARWPVEGPGNAAAS